MAFLSKLFGKKNNVNKENEALEESCENLQDDEICDDHLSDEEIEAAEKLEAEIQNADVEGSENDDTDEIEPIQIDKLLESDDEDALTEEEIAAAEKFEEEQRDEFINTTPLDYDGEFIDFDGDDEPDEEEADDEADDEREEELEKSEAEVEDVSEDDEEEEDGVSFWEKLKNGLSKTKKALFGSVHDMLSSFVRVDEDLLEELEELLIMSDIGVAATEQIIDELRDRIKDGRLKDKDQVIDTLKEILGEMIGEHQPLKLDTTPSVILVIGVNGAGKTTSIGKISKRLRLSGKKVVVAAADTFRAAAIDQLEVWCQRAKVDIVKQHEGSDPAAVVFDAINYAKKKQADVLVIDTAGRLHNKQNLMNELAKINRVIERELPDATRENLLVLDATTGQNAVIQAKEFSKAAAITGITLNKLDGTAKGGIVISIKQELGIPVKFIGVGEKIDDMREFDSKQFIDALFEG